MVTEAWNTKIQHTVTQNVQKARGLRKNARNLMQEVVERCSPMFNFMPVVFLSSNRISCGDTQQQHGL